VSEELGRPSYKAPPATPPRALPPTTTNDPANPTGRRSRRAPGGQGAQQTFPAKPGAAPPKPSKPPKPPKPQKPAMSPKPAAKAKRQQDTPPEATRPAYTPVKPGRSLGHVLWLLLRYTALALVKLTRIMIRIALSPFHAAG
jgi:hypothetical protein